MTWTLAQVALGGAIGSVARFLTVQAAAWLGLTGLPWGTLAVNVIGSFAMGWLAVTLADRGALQAAPFLMTGLLGGFTTFSAFSLETVRLWQDGDPRAAALYVALSVGAAVLALVGGMVLARGFTE